MRDYSILEEDEAYKPDSDPVMDSREGRPEESESELEGEMGRG